MLKKVLKYIPQQSLFTCFVLSLKKDALRNPFLEYLKADPGNLKKLPITGSGEMFNGKAAYELLADRMDEIREMAGNPEWPVRYFAVKLLLNEDSDRSFRGIREAFNDPHPLVRKTVIQECSIKNKDELYSLLRVRITDDPNFEVRKASYDRICRDFADIHEIEYSDLNPVQSLHALEFLSSDSEKDIDASMKFLGVKILS